MNTHEYFLQLCILEVLRERDPLGDVEYQEAELNLVTEGG